MGFGREGYEKAAHKFQKMKEYNSQICQIIMHTQYQKEHNQAWNRNELLEDFRLCQCRLPETWLRSSLLWLREESFPPISLHNRVFADYKQMQGITLNSGRRNVRVDTRPLMSVMTSYAAVLFSMLITTRMTSVVHFPPLLFPNAHILPSDPRLLEHTLQTLETQETLSGHICLMSLENILLDSSFWKSQNDTLRQKMEALGEKS